MGDVIITEAELRLERRSPELIARLAHRYTSEKARRHPTGTASAGCVFKNPPGQSAGKLLDMCGMKGVRVGGAEVSRMHANFICNVSGASAEDVLELIHRMQQAAYEKFNVMLELEIKRWSPRSKVA